MSFRTAIVCCACISFAAAQYLSDTTATGGGGGTANTVSVAGQVTTDTVAACATPAWGGFIRCDGLAGTTTANVGDSIQLEVTSIQTNPDPFAGIGTFTVKYDPTLLTFVRNNAATSCDTATPGTVICPESGLENASAPSGKSDGFFFTVIGSGIIKAHAVVVINDQAGTYPLIAAGAWFNVYVAPAPVICAAR